jgi:hypothetical protein
MLRPALGLVLAVLAAAPLAAAPEPPTVSYKDDRVTMRADDVPVSDVLEALKRQSGAEVRGELPAGKVSATFDDIPLRDALGRILGDRSFTLTYGEDGRLRAIELKGGPQERKPVVEQAARPPEKGPSKKERWDAIAHALDHRRPIAVTGRLAEASGKPEVDWEYLLRAASSHEEEDVRVEAFRAGVREVDQNPELRAAMLEAMNALDDAELAQFARAMVGENAQGLAKWAIRLVHTPELRGRLRAVVRQLRLEERRQAASRG